MAVRSKFEYEQVTQKDDPVKMFLNLSLTEPVHSFRPLGTLEYDQAAHAAAIYLASKKVLKLAFFERKLSRTAWKQVAAQKNFELRGEFAPLVTAELPLTALNKRLTRDMIGNGYTLSFRKLGEFSKYAEDSATFERSFPAGELPPSLNGILRNNSPIIGRFEGSWKKKFDLGILKINWILPYQAHLRILR